MQFAIFFEKCGRNSTKKVEEKTENSHKNFNAIGKQANQFKKNEQRTTSQETIT